MLNNTELVLSSLLSIASIPNKLTLRQYYKYSSYLQADTTAAAVV